MKRLGICVCVAMAILGCARKSEPSAAVNAPVASADVATTPRVHAADASSAHTETAVTTEFNGHAEGRGTEPPIHEIVARVAADAWHGTGTVRLAVPAQDGVVTGEIGLSGLPFRIRGMRSGDHIRAVLDPVILPDAGAEPSEDVFRGTLDAQLSASSIHGTWEASAQAGLHRRSGTLDATRP